MLQKVIVVLWPSFIMAGIATVVFFTAFDPVELLGVQDVSFGTVRLRAYTVGFFLFWLLTAGSSLLTCFFQKPCDNNAA